MIRKIWIGLRLRNGNGSVNPGNPLQWTAAGTPESVAKTGLCSRPPRVCQGASAARQQQRQRCASVPNRRRRHNPVLLFRVDLFTQFVRHAENSSIKQCSITIFAALDRRVCQIFQRHRRARCRASLRPGDQVPPGPCRPSRSSTPGLHRVRKCRLSARPLRAPPERLGQEGRLRPRDRRNSAASSTATGWTRAGWQSPCRQCRGAAMYRLIKCLAPAMAVRGTQ